MDSQKPLIPFNRTLASLAFISSLFFSAWSSALEKTGTISIDETWSGAIETTGIVIIAEGTADFPVQFTSFLDDSIGGDSNEDENASVPEAGDWNGITAQSNATIDLEYTEIHYGHEHYWHC